MSSEQPPARPRRRSAPKPAGPPEVRKLKTTVHLTLEASQRLDIHATMMGMDRSALVEKLINDHPRRWVVSDRGGPGADAPAAEGRGPGAGGCAPTK